MLPVVSLSSPEADMRCVCSRVVAPLHHLTHTQVLQELWAGRAQGELADDQPAAPSGHPGPLSGADLRLLQRLLDLDAGVCKLHQGDSA